MHVVVHIEGREAVPVRAILLATVGNVTAQGLALELAKPDSERRLTAYRYSQRGIIPVRSDAWGMQHEVLTSIALGFKRQEQQTEDPEQDAHRELAWRKSMESLPAGVFVWLDDLEEWYASTRYFSPHSEWEELARVVGEDDDPEPQFQPKPPVLDLFPIAMADCDELVLQGFESCAAIPDAAPAQTETTNLDLELMATREQLITAFGPFTGMDASWFASLKDTPALLAARKVTGQGGRGHIKEPLFCPFQVLTWLIDPRRRKGRELSIYKGWELFESYFPRSYAAYSVGDPRRQLRYPRDVHALLAFVIATDLVQNQVLMATQWLHGHNRKRVCYYFHSGKPLSNLAPRPGLEPGTYGLTVGPEQQATNQHNE
jgi:hypothetical protein